MKNNTKTADNQDIVFFNRIPKTGSQMMQKVGQELGRKLGYLAYIDPSLVTLFPTNRNKEKFVKNFVERLDKPGVYFRHIPWINMTSFSAPTPIWVSMVRDPIERVVSWFYYSCLLYTSPSPRD